jgi:hypothetical protein
MPAAGQIKPSDKALKAYYATLQEYSDGEISHEGAVETAFQRLLADTARSHGWMLVPKLLFKRGGNSPDDPEYIVRLIGQVVCVSVETVKIVNALPSQLS